MKKNIIKLTTLGGCLAVLFILITIVSNIDTSAELSKTAYIIVVFFWALCYAGSIIIAYLSYKVASKCGSVEYFMIPKCTKELIKNLSQFTNLKTKDNVVIYGTTLFGLLAEILIEDGEIGLKFSDGTIEWVKLSELKRKKECQNKK